MIHRREFFKLSSLGLLGAALPGNFVGQSLLSHQFDDTAGFEEFSLVKLQDLMKSGDLNSVQLTEYYLSKIDKIDKNGTRLNAVIELNPEAMKIAMQRDEERAGGKIRGPLHGIPVMIKDNINTADKMHTTAGSLALSGLIAGKDSFVARKLREAGVVILGKTNLSEWANFRSTHSSSGWSSRGGQTHNPYILDRSPCGSSSGSGVTVSANLCAVAIGTETDGSVVCPSATNGIVGIKPTVGLISRSGIIPISFSQDTAGPMARTVEDAAALLGVLTGFDPEDEKTKTIEGKIALDYTLFLDPEALQGKIIGIDRKSFGYHEKLDNVINQNIELIKNAGATLVELDSIISDNSVYDNEFELFLYEFKDGINKYLEMNPGSGMKTLQDLIEFNEANRNTVMPYFGQEIFIEAQKKEGIDSIEYKSLLEKIDKVVRKEGIDRVIAEHNLDAIVAPTGGPAWTIDLVNGDHYLGSSSSLPAMAGYPHITVPAGFIDGLPVGISFYGAAWHEPGLIAIAYAYEQLTRNRQKPSFIDTLKY